MTDSDAEARRELLERFEKALARIGRTIIAGDASDEVLASTVDRAEEFAERMESGSAGKLWGVGSNSRDPEGGAMLMLGTASPATVEKIGKIGYGVEAVVVFSPHHEGPKGFAHGGVIAALFDELCAAAQITVEAPQHSVTRQLDITYHRRTPLERPLQAKAKVTNEDGRSLTVEATLKDGDAILAEARATFRRARAPETEI